jgi:hypothetical protein
MSDFAGLVAAALRDKTVADLKEENDVLRERVAVLEAENAHPTVSVTGPNGFPVYAKAQLDSGTYVDGSWCVHLTTQPGVTCSALVELAGIEIRIGGTGRSVMTGDGRNTGVVGTHNPETNQCKVILMGIQNTLL